MDKKSKKRKRDVSLPEVDSTPEDRYDFALEAAQTLIYFYQAETDKYYWFNTVLTIVTLTGSAVAPLLILLTSKDGINWPHRDFWIAVPSAIAGLAAAINTAFRFKDEWANSYFTLSAIDNERDRFVSRSSPEYSPEKEVSRIVDAFLNRLGEFVMSDVTQWRQAVTQPDRRTHKECLK